MKIRYEFATGEVSEIEVSEELGRAIEEMTHQAALRDRAETRRHVSLDKLLALGAQISGDENSVETLAEQALNRAALLRAMETLEPQRRELVRQVFSSEQTFADIARREGVDRSAVRKRISTPMSFWLESDVWEYLRQNSAPYCPIYDMGYDRTGCIFCMFGAHLDAQPTRFQLLQKTHPQLWRYCMRDWDAGGLGMRQVLEYIGIPYENYQIGATHGNTENSRSPAESGSV